MRSAGGHRRIGVHNAGAAFPSVAIAQTGLPHVVTADPEGALHLPAENVHPIIWDLAVLPEQLRRWLPGSPRTIGIDMMSPLGLQLASAAFPEANVRDISSLIAEVLSRKTEPEILVLRQITELADRAARIGAREGVAALIRALQGAFPVCVPTAENGRARIAIESYGLVAEARHGGTLSSEFRSLLGQLAPGVKVGDLRRHLTDSMMISGIGWGYEAPLVTRRFAAPEDFRLPESSVLLVTDCDCAVTVCIRGSGLDYLSPPPDGFHDDSV
jgi:hypothetical protein